MNGQQLYRYPDAEVRRHTQEHVRSKVLDSQIHSTESKQMSSQRSLLVQQQHENEHMGTLHARLHQEADKIRKWKIQTELDLKDKVKKVAEATLQIDVMKKSLLELQLENERTSARLQEEIGSREDVLQRISATREMCNLLQMHASKVDDRLTKCETERTELKYVGKENMQLIEEVTKQFNNLQMTTIESKKYLQNQTSVERSDRIQTEATMKAKIDAVELEVQDLKGRLQDKDSEINDLRMTIQEKEDNIQDIEKTKEDLQRKVSSLYEDLISKEDELKESSLRISTIQNDKCRIEKAMKELEHEFNSLQISKDGITLDMTEAAKRLEEQITQVKKHAECTKCILEEEQRKLKACKDKLAETSALAEDLKISRDSLMREKTETEMQLDLQKFQINNLLTEKAEDKDEIYTLNGEIVMLTKKLDMENLCRMQSQDEIERLETKISSLMLERDDHLGENVILRDQLSAKQEAVKSLESLLSEEECKTLKLQSEMDKVEQRHICDRKQMQQDEEQIEEMKQEIVNKDADIKLKNKEIDELKNDLQSLKSDIQVKDNESKAFSTELECLRSQISEQDDTIKDLNSQLNDVSKQRKENDKSLTSQQKRIAAIMKQNKNLEKEVKCTKTILDKERNLVKERDIEVMNLQKEFEDLKKMKELSDKSFEQYREEMKKIKELCQHEQEEARCAIRKGEEMQESAQKEKQNALSRTDCQLAEMMATLDAYKENNEKLISVKDAEVQALVAKLEKAESLAVHHERELSEVKKENGNLKIQMASKTEKSCEPAVKESVLSGKQSPRTPVPATPKKTQQGSILRSCNLVSVSKRRKVAFAPDSPHSSSEESDLMEFNTESVTFNKIGTPLLVKISPKARNVDNFSTVNPSKVTPRRTAGSRTSVVAPDKQIMSEGKTANVRKTPAKQVSKIFTTSPRSKISASKTKIKEKTKPNQMSWFELDSVYGFGPED